MKKITAALLFVCILPNLFSQVIADPNDKLYDYLSLWHEAGYIDRLPLIQPYSPQEVVGFLDVVVSRGDKLSREIAREYLDEIMPSGTGGYPGTEVLPGKVFPGRIHFSFESDTWSNFENHSSKNYAQFSSNGFFSEGTAYSGKVYIGATGDNGQIPAPGYLEVYDESESGGGVIELDNNTLTMAQLGIGGLFFGTENLIFKAGIMRTSFGPFFDNGPVVTPEAPAAGHFSFTYNRDWLEFSSLFLDLNAKYEFDPDTGALKKVRPPEGKYVINHTIRAFPTDWFNGGIIQTIVTGGRFNPVYLIPISHTFFTQELYGGRDNSILGFFGQFSLPYALQANFIIYVDDWDALSSSAKQEGNKINLDSAQNKYAMEMGFSWSPCLDFFRKAEISYLKITPYMYTHGAKYPVSFLSYTHDGKNLGSILKPNSDQLEVEINTMPAAWLDIVLWSKYTRHGNASEGFEEDGVQSDGSVFDDGFLSDGTATFYGPGRFLTQSIIEKTFQVGVEFDIALPAYVGRTNLQLKYIFENTHDKNLIAGNDSIDHFIEVFLKKQI
jgi:hypothetical protein